MHHLTSVASIALLSTVVGCGSIATRVDTGTSSRTMHESGRFEGPKANTGRVTHSVDGRRDLLTLSADFVAPDTPDPHWQIVDSMGGRHLLDRLMLKGDRLSRTIEIPAHVPDVASVEIWCAWAETVLGEARFPGTLSLAGRSVHRP